MPKLVSALLVKDEADRWLRPCLERLSEVSDTIVVLDDNSTDATPDVARGMGCEVTVRSGEAMWGQEAHARAELWELGASRCGPRDWLLIADADMILRGDPRPYLLSTAVTAWSWILYDLWDATHYRSDTYWRGHEFPRPWLFRPASLNEPPVWPERGIHCGHCPTNFRILTANAPTLGWEHRAYSTPEARQQKHAAYMRQAAQLTPFELAHAESILDAD